MPHISPDPRIQRIVNFFEMLTPQAVAKMGDLYTADAYFKDPFNEVRGLADVQHIFSHMYVSLHEPHFVVTNTVTQGDQCFIVWDFKFRFKRFDTPMVVLHFTAIIGMQRKSCTRSCPMLAL
jgi:steroid Delta-isomerase